MTFAGDNKEDDADDNYNNNYSDDKNDPTVWAHNTAVAPVVNRGYCSCLSTFMQNSGQCARGGKSTSSFVLEIFPFSTFAKKGDRVELSLLLYVVERINIP